jgi:hypothetical protein
MATVVRIAYVGGEVEAQIEDCSNTPGDKAEAMLYPPAWGMGRCRKW